MGLLDLLKSGVSKLGYSGKQPPYNPETAKSTLHNTYSLNGSPKLKNLPQPTSLAPKFKDKTPPLYSESGLK